MPLTIQPPSVFCAAGAERRRIGQQIIGGVVRLGNADRQHAARICGEVRQHPRLLLFVERVLHDLRDLQRLRDDHRDAEVALAQLLDDHGGRQRIRAEAAPFLGERHGADAGVVRLLDDLPGKARLRILLGVERGRARPDLFVDEALDGLEDEALILVHDEDVLHGRLLCSRGCDGSELCLGSIRMNARRTSPRRAARNFAPLIIERYAH